MDEKKLVQAKAVFDTLCRSLDNRKWNYKKNEEELTVECGVQSEDLPIEISIKIDVDRRLAMLISHIPLVVKEDKRLDAAIAVSAVNNMLVDGSFDYNIASGHMFFRMTNSFIESTISEEVFFYMIFCSCQTIDEYNDKFLMLAKGMVSVEQFLASIKN